MPKLKYQIKNSPGRKPKTKDVTGETFAEAPGLAIRKDEFGWKVDHIPSGNFLESFYLKRHAKIFALYVASKVNCEQSGEKLTREVKRRKLGKKFRLAVYEIKDGKRK